MRIKYFCYFYDIFPEKDLTSRKGKPDQAAHGRGYAIDFIEGKFVCAISPSPAIGQIETEFTARITAPGEEERQLNGPSFPEYGIYMPKRGIRHHSLSYLISSELFIQAGMYN
jgi:hypothetical protein